MESYYIDESGSMTKTRLTYVPNQKFVTCVVRVHNVKRLNKVFKRFVSKYLEDLRILDTGKNKLFYPDGKFKELKGSMLDDAMKSNFIDFFCQNNLFEIYYISCDNTLVTDMFYANVSRAFNYLLKLLIEHLSKESIIPSAHNYFLIDERNVKTNTKSTLEEYLNTELVTGHRLHHRFQVEYKASESVALIQVADVFSNIYFGFLTGNFLADRIQEMTINGYIKKVFPFPIV